MEPSVLKKLHETQVEILDEIDRICKKHNITYFLEAGTLLGAVRHKGFVPWDDDVDIAMPREDYEQFLKICKSELSEKFQVLDQNTKNYPFLFAKIQKINTLFLPKKWSSNIKYGICVDVFPYDNAKPGYVTHLRAAIVKRLTRWGYRKLGFVKNNKSINDRIITALLSFQNVNFIMKCRDYFYFYRIEINHNHHTYFICRANQDEPERALWLKEKILPVSQGVFEGKAYPIPRDSDYFLRIRYGDDYMQLPPVEKRISHDPVRISFNMEEGYEKEINNCND